MEAEDLGARGLCFCTEGSTNIIYKGKAARKNRLFWRKQKSFLMSQVQIECRQVKRVEARKANKDEILKGNISNPQDSELYPDKWRAAKAF